MQGGMWSCRLSSGGALGELSLAYCACSCCCSCWPRAELSYTHRHLCEFMGLDLEMAIYEHYFEVLDVIEKLFRAIFDGLAGKYGE